ncbi:MAG: sigma-54-dependent Fis family transcriptional regulator [Clostridiaceae bacterium]
MYRIYEQREIIKESHKRSEDLGIERERVLPKKVIAEEELREILRKNKTLINIAQPFIDMLYQVLEGSGFILLLTDREGCILSITGDKEVLEEAKALDMIVGAYMNEASIGTNAMGIAIKEDSPIQISAKEHFITVYHRWTCSAAPIHDTQGNIIGTLNLTGESYRVHPHTLGLVVAAVNYIDTRMKMEQENRAYKAGKGVLGARYTLEDFIGESSEIVKLKAYVERIASSSSTVLIQGESGTGKEILSQAIHNLSPRKNKSFVAINCGAIPENLIESELFGYEEGAFSGGRRGGKIGKFQLANGGTLFLDEIGEMPLNMQVNLLRVLQEGIINPVGSNKYIPVDVRIIAATNKDLKKKVQQGSFREDLYYRLSVLPVYVPPLRERKEDIKLLVDSFIRRKAKKLGIKEFSLEPNVYVELSKNSWKGNVRELENFIEKTLNLEGKLEEAYPNTIAPIYEKADIIKGGYQEDRIPKLWEMERQLICRALTKHHGNISKVAKDLGIGRNTLYSKIKKYKIDQAKEE